MLYSIVEPLNSRADFVVHKKGCKDIPPMSTIYIMDSTTARFAAEKFIEQEYDDLNHELGFGSYKIMRCCKE
jgi:hypothetical protein